MNESIYATLRQVTDLNECFFYHTMEIPGYGLVKGEWDLRGRVRQYLGEVDFQNKRVLEVGTADGFLCFQMESQGAQVVAYDLSDRQAWDMVPYAADNIQQLEAERKGKIKKINNAFWLSHRAFHSQARMVYGTVYEVPPVVGPVDISTFGAVLLHVRDPFLALQNVLRLTRETVIITEPLWKQRLPQRILAQFHTRLTRGRHIVFLPDFQRREPKDGWWMLSPEIIRQFIGVLGFEKTRIIYHSQNLEALGERNLVPFYTIVGSRTIALSA